MKKLSAVFLVVALSIGVFLNQGNGQTITIRNYVNDEIIDADQIIQNIETPLSDLATGIVERDARLIFGIFSDPDKARYVRDGAIYKSITAAEESYTRRFGRQDHSIKRVFEFKQKEYDIINPTTVLFTGIGVLEDAEPSAESEPWEIAYTILWVLNPDGWKAINMHISWE
jgi:hypothetical protein